MTHTTRRRSRAARITVAALVIAGISFAVAPTVRDQATAAGSNLLCDQNSLYGITSGGDVIQIDATTGATTSIDSFSPATNALGITLDGTEAVAFESNGNNLVRYDPLGGIATTIASPDPDGNQIAIRGAVNPVTNIFYYGGSGASARLAAFDLTTGTAIGQVGTITGLGGSNGDMAFGSDGTLYVVDGAKVYQVGTVPVVAGTTSLPASEILTLPGGTNSPGIAYSSDGYLFLAASSASSTIYKINPSSGANVASITISTAQTVVDLATCNYANSLRGEVDVRSRGAATDQFVVVNSGNGISSGNSAVTSGNVAGVQPVTAGPNLTLGGANYSVTLTGSGTTDLTKYSLGWTCVNRTTSLQVATGTGAVASFTNPMTSTAAGTDVVCTFIAALLPKAKDDGYSTTIGTTLTVAAKGLLTNDTGATVTVTSNTAAAHGTASVAADGSFSYAPTAGYTGTDTFDYTITDVNGATSTATATIQVNPVAAADSYATPADTPLTISDLTANDNPTTMTVQSVTAPSHGTAVLNGDGTVTYTPTVGYTGPDSFSYTAVTAGGRTATATVTMSVSAVAVDDQATGSPDTATTVHPLTNDKPTAGFAFDVTSLRIQDPGTLAWVNQVVVAGVGTWQITGNELTLAPVNGYTGTTSMDYRVVDTAGNTVAARATVVYLPTMALAYTNVAPPGIGEWAIGGEALLVGLALVLFAGLRRRRQATPKHRAA